MGENTRRFSRRYGWLVVSIATANLLDLTGLVDMPLPIPAALFALNTVLFVKLIHARRDDQHAARIAAVSLQRHARGL